MTQVLHRLRTSGLIMGELNSDCVLGGKGYSPGPAVPELYALGESKHPFWKLRTCGVEPEVGRGFNYWAYGPSCEGSTCPKCNAPYEPWNDLLRDEFSRAIELWMRQSGPALVKCAICAGDVRLTDWLWHPPLAFSNLRFTFWNWPPFELPAWRIDVRALVEEALGHRSVYTYGRL
jgi:hypothetical protein